MSESNDSVLSLTITTGGLSFGGGGGHGSHGEAGEAEAHPQRPKPSPAFMLRLKDNIDSVTNEASANCLDIFRIGDFSK